MVGEAAHEAEDGPLEHECADKLGHAARFAVLGMRRLVLVDQAPYLLEDLAADDARGETEAMLNGVNASFM